MAYKNDADAIAWRERNKERRNKHITQTTQNLLRSLGFVKHTTLG